jgi:hypothetical protein
MKKLTKTLAELVHEIELARGYENTEKEYQALKKELIRAYSEIILKQISDLVKAL